MTDAQNETVVEVQVVSDVMCPWCFIGKRRLEKAIEMLDPSIKVRVEWKPFQLDATLPEEGKDRQLYLTEKFGSKESADAKYSHIKQAGIDEDIPFDFDAITVSPNTLNAHRVIAWAGQMGHHRQDRVVQRLFEAYFTEGKNIGDKAVLATVAADAGMDPSAVVAKLDSDEGRQEAQQAVVNAHHMGVTGVPCFIIEQKYGISGAQAPETLANAISKIASEKSPTDA